MIEISKKEITEYVSRRSALDHYYAALPSGEEAAATRRPTLVMPRMLERHLPLLWFSLEWLLFRLSAWIEVAESEPAEYVRLRLLPAAGGDEEHWHRRLLALTGLLFHAKLAASRDENAGTRAYAEFESRLETFIASLA